MAPKTILVMRHAEKPGEGSGLSPAGKDRADKLVKYIPKTLGKPDRLFAAADSESSDRPYDTITPLAKSLGKKIHAKIKDKDVADLKAKLDDSKYDGDLVLVCWHHEEIPPLLDALGAPRASYAEKWPDDVFDLVVRLDEHGEAPIVSWHREPF